MVGGGGVGIPFFFFFFFDIASHLEVRCGAVGRMRMRVRMARRSSARDGGSVSIYIFSRLRSMGESLEFFFF